ncbi:MAG: insulinase family protein [Clostridia bacterium]|nr:insulinase family protein [Clostridia bacterium]
MRMFPELGGTLTELEHERSGAKLCWLNRPDENAGFCIALKTPISNSTGVSHILQHTVFCGSEQYRVKDLHQEFRKNSVLTFWNARTYPDKTVYLGSSRNGRDFLNLLDINLDGILHPAVLHRPEIFRQEGWRYEFEGNVPVYQGIVLNEMRGDCAAVDSIVDNELFRLLYPDNCYRFESGGNPLKIPDLTYEALCEAHQKYYHPSNMRISLSGEIDAEAVLERLDSYLRAYERKPIETDIPLQQPIPPAANVLSYEIDEDESPESRSVIGCGLLLGSFDDRERLLAAALLIEYLAGDSKAPLSRAVIDRGLAEKFEFILFDWLQQPTVYWQATNTDPEKLPMLYATIREVLGGIVERGLDHDRFEACFHRFAFRLRDRDAIGELPRSVNETLSMLNTWLYGGDPADALLAEPFIASLSEKLHTGYYEQLIRELFLENRHTATVLLVPSRTLGAEKRDLERTRIEAERAVWTDADRKRLDAETEALRRWQQTPDSDDALASVPKLTLNDLNDRPPLPHCDPAERNGVPVLYHTVESGLSYCKAFFAADDLSEADLPLLPLLCELLGKLPTARLDRDALPLAINKTIGKLTVSPLILPGSVPDRCRILLSAAVACTRDQTVSAATLLSELLTETVWTDAELLRETLRQMLIDERSSLLKDGGYRYAETRVLASQTAQGFVNEQISGVSYLRWLERAVRINDCTDLLSRLKSLAHRIFARERLTLSCSESVPDAALSILTETIPVSGFPRPAEAVFAPWEIRAEGFIIPSEVGYAVLGNNTYRHGRPFFAGISVFSILLSYSYLWDEIRLKGGAADCGLRSPSNGDLLFESYGDPQPVRSIEVMRHAAEFVRNYVSTGPDLTGSILSAAAILLDRLRTAEEKMAEAERRWFLGITDEEAVRQYQELLHTTPDDLLQLCDALDDIVRDNAICVIGGKDLLKSCGDMLDSVISI